MKLFFIILSLLFFSSKNVKAEQISSRIGHLYWGLGPNFGLLGNIRLGFGNIEIGVLQGTGFGVAYVHRTSTPLFMQIGVLGTSGGGGIIGGGGMEWNTSSFFRWRTDITVSTDKAYQTQAFVSVGGVLIL